MTRTNKSLALALGSLLAVSFGVADATAQTTISSATTTALTTNGVAGGYTVSSGW